MLQSLKIENLVLISKTTIPFGEGLNILTGETGAGKSVLLTAIRLITGEKSSADLIREGASCAIIEAELSDFSAQLPEEIDCPRPGEPLLIRREILRSGKSRCFIQDHLIPAAFLRKIIQSSIEIVDQSSSQTLCSKEAQQTMLDAFAGLEQELIVFSNSFKEETKLKKQLDAAIQANMHRERDLEWAESCIQRIEETNWQQDEENQLTEEHNLLTHAQERIEKIGTLTEELAVASPQIKRLSHLLDTLLKFDHQLVPIAEIFKSASLEIEEVEAQLQSYLGKCETDPERLAAVEQRIAAIDQLKRRFGASWEEVEKQKIKCSRQIEQLNALEDQINTLKEELDRLQKQHLDTAQIISERRKAAAHVFSKQVLEELKSLNLPYAQFEITLDTQPISSNGIDAIRFLFSANPGLSPIPLEQCASGGELSRLLLAIKIVLSEKENCKCLIFDEIDSNVGGQTAAILGEKLRKLARLRQVICVTHFAQVAKAAMHHFGVYKTESNGVATTTVKKLVQKDLEIEYNRMIGH